MHNDIESVFSSVGFEIQKFRNEFSKLMRTDVKILHYILKYLFAKKGKQIRPLFMILASGMCGKITDETYKGAALIELLHTATLIHDDIVDGSNYRRGMFTVNALWKNKIAVLTGDYLLAAGLHCALNNDYFQTLKYVTTAALKISEGELLQLQNARKIKPDEETYYKIIENKTAVLFAVSFQCGGYTAETDENTMNNLYRAGLNVGMAFQIKDDILDFIPANTGKKAFIDVKEQKLTLPVIHALNNSTFPEVIKYRKMLKKIKKTKSVPANFINWINNKGSLEYSTNIMNEYKNKAIDILDSFADNKYKDLIKKTINYVTTRDH